jgi:hypothetical protein
MLSAAQRCLCMRRQHCACEAAWGDSACKDCCGARPLDRGSCHTAKASTPLSAALAVGLRVVGLLLFSCKVAPETQLCNSGTQWFLCVLVVLSGYVV